MLTKIALLPRATANIIRRAAVRKLRPVGDRESGLNENTNVLIRDFFPKGTNFSTITAAEVAKVERLLNARPRKSLGFRSPQEVFFRRFFPLVFYALAT